MASNTIFYLDIKEDIQISIPTKSHFSLGTSPYYAHQHGLAIDIYHNISIENYFVMSPVSGKIITIKELKAPVPKFQNGISKEYLILLENEANKDILFKILHIKPYAKVGQRIEAGEILGRTIRNGYFAYWSSPHIHLEVRSPHHPLRAKGGKELSFLSRSRPCGNINDKKSASSKKIPLIIKSIFPEFLLTNAPEALYGTMNSIYGLKGLIDNKECLIDGGIPLYKQGIAIFPDKIKALENKDVYIAQDRIGRVSKIRDNLCFFECEKVRFFLNNREIRGISLFLSNTIPYIKLIPYRKNQFSFKENSTPFLTISQI